MSCHQGFFLLFQSGISPYNKSKEISLGFPDIHHLLDGWTEWVMHGQVQQQT